MVFFFHIPHYYFRHHLLHLLKLVLLDFVWKSALLSILRKTWKNLEEPDEVKQNTIALNNYLAFVRSTKAR